MLIAKNQKHRILNRIIEPWSSFEDYEEDAVNLGYGGARIGLALIPLEKEEKYQLGYFYATISGRVIVSTHDTIYALGMDDSNFFKSEVECFIETEFEKTKKEIEIITIPIERAYYRPDYRDGELYGPCPPDYERNAKIIGILEKFVNIEFNNILKNIIVELHQVDINIQPKDFFEFLGLKGIQHLDEILDNINKQI